MSEQQSLEVNEHFDIVIVGAGLVGATFAALLTKDKHIQSLGEDFRIAVIDGGPAPSLPELNQEPPTFDPRVVALTHASQSIFESLDVWQTVCSGRACYYDHMHVWDDEGTAHIHFSASDIQEQQLGHIVENSLLQCAVLDVVEQHQQIHLLRGMTVTELTTAADGYNKTESNPTIIYCSDGRILSTSLLVAADGGQSKIRELAKLATREWDYQHKAIVATVQSSQSHQYTAWQNFLSSGPLAFLPLDHPSEQYCSIVWSLETEKADAMMALDDDDFSYELERAFESRLGNVLSVSRRFCFPLRQRHATNYSANGIVLIGDAAHTIHPLAGQGVNLGLLDAQVLSQEISRAIDRDLPVSEVSILSRYQRQRKTHNMEVMLLMEGFKRLFGSQQLWVRLLRNVGMRKVNEFTLLKNWLAKQAIKKTPS